MIELPNHRGSFQLRRYKSHTDAEMNHRDGLPRARPNGNATGKPSTDRAKIHSNLGPTPNNLHRTHRTLRTGPMLNQSLNRIPDQPGVDADRQVDGEAKVVA